MIIMKIEEWAESAEENKDINYIADKLKIIRKNN